MRKNLSAGQGVCQLLNAKPSVKHNSDASRFFPLHRQPDSGRHAGVVEGAVILPVEAGVGEEVEVDGFQGVVRKAGETAPAELQRTEVRVGEAHPQPGEFVAEEADVEGGVVGDQNALPDELVKQGKDLLRRRLPCEHLVGDPVDRLDGVGDRHPGVDQRGELPDDGPLLDGDRADLDHPVALAGRQAGRFDVDDHMAVKQAHDLRFIRFLRTFD